MATSTSPPTLAPPFTPTFTPTYTPTYATPSITTTIVPTSTETTSTTTPYTTTSRGTYTITTLPGTSTSNLPSTTSLSTSDSTTISSLPPYDSTTTISTVAPTETPYRSDNGPFPIGGLVGIIVAAVVACIALGILVVVLYRQRRRRRLDRNSNTVFNPVSTDMRENRRPNGSGNDGTGLGMMGNSYQHSGGHAGMSQDLLNTSTLGASGFSGRSGEIGYGSNRLNTGAGGMNDYMDNGNWQRQRQHRPQYDPRYAALQEQDIAYMQYQQRMQEQQAAADAAAGYYGSQYVYPEPQNGYYTDRIYSHDDGRHLHQETHGYDLGPGQVYNDNTHATSMQDPPHRDMNPSQHQFDNNSVYGGVKFPTPTDAPTSQYMYPESDARYTRTEPWTTQNPTAHPSSTGFTPATRLDADQFEGQQDTSMGPTSGIPKTTNSPQHIPSPRRGPQALYQESEPATR